jgi:hypothetical protein
MLDHLITDDREVEETYYHKNTRKKIEEPIQTCDGTEFAQGKQTIEGFSGKKTPAIDGITSGIFTNI